jgi:hypothetical protein
VTKVRLEASGVRGVGTGQREEAVATVEKIKWSKKRARFCYRVRRGVDDGDTPAAATITGKTMSRPSGSAPMAAPGDG